MISVNKADMTKVRIGTSISVKQHSDGKVESFRELISGPRPRIVGSVKEALYVNKSTQNKLRDAIAYVRTVEYVDTHIASHTIQLVVSPNND